MLAPAPGSLQIDATLGGGGHTERILEATNPDGRLLGLDADGAAIARVERSPSVPVRRSARPAPGELPRRSRRSPGRPASAPSTGCCSTSACRASSSRTPSAGSASGPAARSTCASTPPAACPPRELLATLDTARADGAVPALRRGAAGAAGSPGPIVAARRTAPDHHGRGAGGARRASRARRTRVSAAGSIRRPASSRRSGSRSTRSSMHSRTGLPPRSTSCGRAAGSSS